MDIQALTQEVAKVSETYAETIGFVRDDDWYVLKLQEELGELTQSYLKRTGRARGRQNADELEAAFAAELADVVCHALLVADHFGVDVTQTIREKWLSRLGETSRPR